MALKLPTFQWRNAVVDRMGMATVAFQRFLSEYSGAIERQEADQAAVLLQLQEVQASQAQTLADLAAVVADLQSLSESTQQAQTAANEAQSSADAAAGGTAVSGSATDPAVTLTGTGWIIGPQVDLAGVVAGDLQITGSGPIQDDDVTMTGGQGIVTCEFRIVEVVGGIDDVLFTGSFTVRNFVDQVTFDISTIVSNTSASSVSAFLDARTSTGAVSYRIDARMTTSGRTVDSLLLYVYARRA